MRQVNTLSLTKALQEIRDHSIHSFECYRRADRLSVPLQSGLNPPVWELGHVAWFQEYWIGRNQQRTEGLACDPIHQRERSLLADADAWFDSAKVVHSKRWDTRLPSYKECLQFADQTLTQTLTLLQKESNSSHALYFYWLVLQHEAMHLEASAYMAQSLQIPFTGNWQTSTATATSHLGHKKVRVPAQTWRLGYRVSKANAHDMTYCFDNELEEQTSAIQSFEIDLEAVDWAKYLDFVNATDHPLPRYVRKRGVDFELQEFGVWAPLNIHSPAVHLSWEDVQSYCAWAKCRLPTEAEWDCAAKTLTDFAWGDVWEWTQDTFKPYEGFAPHPYVEYSMPWFGTHKVLRGASRMTHPVLKHVNYRNFFTPERTDIYAGFRTCAL